MQQIRKNNEILDDKINEAYPRIFRSRSHARLAPHQIVLDFQMKDPVRAPKENRFFSVGNPEVALVEILSVSVLWDS